jgi:hypothetical protein
LLLAFERFDCRNEGLVLSAVKRRTTSLRGFVSTATTAAVAAIATSGREAILGVRYRYSCFVDNIQSATGTARLIFLFSGARLFLVPLLRFLFFLFVFLLRLFLRFFLGIQILIATRRAILRLLLVFTVQGRSLLK